MRTRTDTALIGMAWVRIGLGALFWCFPAAANRVFLVPREQDGPTLRYMNRIFGARAIALGLGYILSPTEQRRLGNQLWLMVDGADTVMGLQMALRGDLTRSQAVELLALTGGATLVDAVCLQAESKRSARSAR